MIGRKHTCPLESPRGLAIIFLAILLVASLAGGLVSLDLGLMVRVLAGAAIALVIGAPLTYFLVYRPCFRQFEKNRSSLEELKVSGNRYRLLLDTLDEGVVALDEDDRTTYLNRRALEISGYEADGLLGISPLGLLEEEERRAAERVLERLRAVGDSDRLFAEVNSRRKNGEPLTVRLGVSSLRDESGRYTGAIVGISDVTNERITESQLRDSQMQLRALARRLQAIREEERVSLAREVHDEVGQVLATVRLGVTLAAEDCQDQTELCDKLHDLEELLAGAIVSVRSILVRMRPTLLDELGLSEAIEWQTREFQRRTGIACDLSVLLDDEALDPEASLAVFRICQEALANVARHSRADHIDVEIEVDGDRLVLRVEDNGRGIDADRPRNSQALGIAGMRERALAVGGDAAVTGTGSGTLVAAWVPVARPTAGEEVPIS